MKRADPSKQPGVKIAQILLEEATFGHRGDYLTSSTTPTPDNIVGTLNIELQTGVSADGKNGLVRLRVTTIPENRPFYEFDVAMVALVTVDETAANMPLDQYVKVGGALLYPFVREVVAELTWRGRFGPVWLNPVNFIAPSPPEASIGSSKPRSRIGRGKKRAKARS